MILCKKDIEIRWILNTHDGFAVLTLNEHHADNIFATDTKLVLTQNGFTPLYLQT